MFYPVIPKVQKEPPMYAPIHKSYSTFTLQYSLYPLLVLSVILHFPFFKAVTTPLLETLTIPFYLLSILSYQICSFDILLLSVRISCRLSVFALFPFFVGAVITVLPDFLAVILPLLEKHLVSLAILV